MGEESDIDRHLPDQVCVEEPFLYADISDRAFRLRFTLSFFEIKLDSDSDFVGPERGELAQRLHCTDDEIDDALRELIEAGVLDELDARVWWKLR